MLKHTLLASVLSTTLAFAAENVEEHYSNDYCRQLSLAYGEGMMSEGGITGIQHMFKGIALNKGEHALDFGCGLGGVGCYLAQTHAMKVTGLDVNQRMIESNRDSLPKNLNDLVTYVHTAPGDALPFANESFEIVYSKGVLCHVEHKDPLFKEFHRVLKPGGTLVITDWLSPNQGQWCDKVNELCELEPLVLFAHNEMHYFSTLNRAGFKNIGMTDDNSHAYVWNSEIIQRLQGPSIQETYTNDFGVQAYHDAIKGYQLIADSIQLKETLVRRFVAKKV